MTTSVSANSQRETFGVRTLLGDQSPALASGSPLEAPLVARGCVTRFAAITDEPALRSASTVLDAWDGSDRTARAWSPVDGPAYELFPTPEQLQTLYNAGWTIVLGAVERFVAALRPLCRALERDLDIGVGRVSVEAFCARGAGHSRPHFDPSFNFNCQIAGTKTWRLACDDAVRFPPTGMFLGRPPEAQMARILHAPLPSTIEGGETAVAEPGTVVFLPPGVLHETRTASGSYAIGFAIEQVDTIAGSVADTVRAELEKIPVLRAGRFGAQFRDVRDEACLAAGQLRRIADELESREWPEVTARLRLRPGLSAESLGDGRIVLRSASAERTLSLDDVPATILGWASGQSAFSARDIAWALPWLDPGATDACVHLLLHRGLLERVP